MTDVHARLALNGTPLQKHCLFFDRDNDGYIDLLDTFLGCRAIGMNIILAAFATVIINFSLAWPTNNTWLPTTTINVKNIKYSRHGSDSQIYDSEGNFSQERFDAFWRKWDKTGRGYVDWPTLWQRIKDEKNVFDFFGWMSTFLEWSFLYLVAAENGKVSKDAVRGVFDGSLFYELEEKYKKTASNKKTH